MNNWNQVEATVFIGGKECKFTNLTLNQVFDGHHSFDIGILCPLLPGKSIWYNEREDMIARQGERVEIRMKHVVSGDENRFKGIITEISMEGERGVSGTIHYRGYSPTILLESGKTLDSFMDYPLSSIVNEVVRKYGNGIEVVNKPLLDDPLPYIQMQEETAYEFLRRIAFQYGEWFYYDGQKLYFGNPRKDNNETVTYDVDLETVTFGSRLAPFHYSRHDYMAEADRPLYADDSMRINGINTYLANAISTSESVYHSSTTMYNKSVVGHPVHIDSLLEIEKGRDIASLICVSGKSNTCRIRIGEPIVVDIPPSMAERRDLGRYRVMSVTHQIDKSGVYFNTFEAIPAAMERIPVSSVVLPQARSMLAKVIDNADPQNQGRVQVQFAWQERNKTTNWIRVRTLDAGSSDVVSKNRGLTFIPEKDDQVMVDFELGDPSRPYVCGSMFHKGNSEGGKSDNCIKSIITRSGHLLEFNDDEGGAWGITIEDRKKNTIKINSADDAIFITADKDVTITAGETLTFNAKNLNVNVQESMNMNIKGNASIDVGKDTKLATANLKATLNDNLNVNVGKNFVCKSGDVEIESFKGDLVLKSASKALLQGAEDARISKG